MKNKTYGLNFIPNKPMAQKNEKKITFSEKDRKLDLDKFVSAQGFEEIQ